jgi:hypothetical protein
MSVASHTSVKTHVDYPTYQLLPIGVRSYLFFKVRVRVNTIKYDIACETKHILPPNLRHKLEPYNWPKSICPDIIKTINDHEQAIWKETLERIANIRHQTIVDDLERITYRI